MHKHFSTLLEHDTKSPFKLKKIFYKINFKNSPCNCRNIEALFIDAPIFFRLNTSLLRELSECQTNYWTRSCMIADGASFYLLRHNIKVSRSSLPRCMNYLLVSFSISCMSIVRLPLFFQFPPSPLSFAC